MELDSGIAIERRFGSDRRRRRWPPFKVWIGKGRRRQVRRRVDQLNYAFLDQYSPGHFSIVMAIILLCLADAFFTLILIGRGAREMNPVMALSLNYGPTAFVVIKYLLTSLSIFVLIIVSHTELCRNGFIGRSIWSTILSMMVLVVGWEIYLILY